MAGVASETAPTGAPRPGGELLDAYLTDLRAHRNLSPYTLRNYATDLSGFLLFLGDEGTGPLRADRHALRGGPRPSGGRGGCRLASGRGSPTRPWASATALSWNCSMPPACVSAS